MSSNPAKKYYIAKISWRWREGSDPWAYTERVVTVHGNEEEVRSELRKEKIEIVFIDGLTREKYLKLKG